MAFFQNASDDQVALIGCAAALLVSFGVMAISYYIGRSNHQGAAPSTVRLPQAQESPQRRDKAA